MTGVACLFLGALIVVCVLLAIAIGANANLVAQVRKLSRENARLRRENRQLRHPSARILPGEQPLFDLTLAEIRGLPEPNDGGAA